MGLDRGAAVAREDIDHRLEEMALRRGLAAGRDVDDQYGCEIAPAPEVHQRPIGLHPGPGLGPPLARAFVDLTGGQIGFDSIPETGPSFYFTLPLSGNSPERFGNPLEDD